MEAFVCLANFLAKSAVEKKWVQLQVVAIVVKICTRERQNVHLSKLKSYFLSFLFVFFFLLHGSHQDQDSLGYSSSW